MYLCFIGVILNVNVYDSSAGGDGDGGASAGGAKAKEPKKKGGCMIL